MLELNKIYCGDNVEICKQIDDNSIDMSIQSPPYDNLRKYQGFLWDFEEIAKQLYRITKIGGIVVWVVGDATINGSETGSSFKQALFFKEIGFNLHDTMIYQKSSPMPKNHKRYEQSFEYMFVFCKGKPKTFNPILEKCKMAGKINKGKMRNEGKDDLSIKHGYGKTIKEMKIKNNIWIIESAFKNKYPNHPAVFPEQLAKDHIISWSNENDLVLDAFNGSGTTTKMAKLLKRNFIGIDCSKEYCDIARERLNLINH